ncbi:ABC transporter ATP-binding protein [Neobacillus sp. YIM B02564]|uniref:ABC transporter ATP-binding protein n=1 Tax=Neobacillus paridis TaxID=2803862 RepID=A0ABS1TUD4_9BACI|nr:ABC transporter ATP-binding protein [Neobacillus paridis]MBL4954922.1 ABC transporter ATP-binding protein [Neobacillus paridis]
MELLKIAKVSREFGGLKAIDDVSFSVKKGAIHGVIGPNGSGKTTLFNVVSGHYKPTSGEVWFENKPIHKLPPYKICRAGLARTFQNLRLFKQMTVLENICAVLDESSGVRILDYFLFLNRVLRIEKETVLKAEKLLEDFNLSEWWNVQADSLPYGVQKRMEIARALATNPKLLLLDEPAAGLNHTETDELSGIIKHIRDDLGITVVLIEHDMKMVMSICETITVLNEGHLLIEGTPEVVSNDKQVISAYLGGEW